MTFVTSAIFSLALVVSLGAVGARDLPLGGGLWRGPLLKQYLEGQADVQYCPLLFHIQA